SYFVPLRGTGAPWCAITPPYSILYRCLRGKERFEREVVRRTDFWKGRVGALNRDTWLYIRGRRTKQSPQRFPQFQETMPRILLGHSIRFGMNITVADIVNIIQ